MFRLVSTWNLPASPEQVWDAVAKVEDWPRWWRAVTATVVVRPPRADGSGQRSAIVVRSPWGYRLSFGVEVVEVRPPHVAIARVVGDLAGVGCWSARPAEGGSVATIRWEVEPSRGLLRLLAGPFERPLVWAHGHVMREGEQGLLARLGQHYPQP